jgi:hypothetical protein
MRIKPATQGALWVPEMRPCGLTWGLSERRSQRPRLRELRDLPETPGNPTIGFVHRDPRVPSSVRHSHREVAGSRPRRCNPESETMAADSVAASRHRCECERRRDLDRGRRPEVDTGGSRRSPKLASNDGSFGKTAGQPARTYFRHPQGRAKHLLSMPRRVFGTHTGHWWTLRPRLWLT